MPPKGKGRSRSSSRSRLRSAEERQNDQEEESKDPHQEESAELPIILPILIFVAIGTLGIISSGKKKKVKEEE